LKAVRIDILQLLGFDFDDIYEECERHMIEMVELIRLREYYELNQNLVVPDEAV
jgi:hypothetical protein